MIALGRIGRFRLDDPALRCGLKNNLSFSVGRRLFSVASCLIG
jgi:hypothetical protein